MRRQLNHRVFGLDEANALVVRAQFYENCLFFVLARSDGADGGRPYHARKKKNVKEEQTEFIARARSECGKETRTKRRVE